MNTIGQTEPPRPVIPDHEVLRCIGRGSFGFVWLARNMMGSYRAVKVVSRRAFENPKPYERELAGIRRFEPVSRLHEGFVDILHVGINEGEEYFYYIMELGDDQIQGQTIDPESYSPKTLAQEISLRGKLFLQECVQLGLGLSGALEELHGRGLVHRDIKPANIIFVHGVPKLADAGLVADVKDAPTYTGTKGYIPPEGPGTPQADIYSLGKVLYEAATGKDREEFPELPALPADPLENRRFLDLNEIIIEACQNDIKSRYRSVWDMHSDLQLIADNVSVREVKVLRRRVAVLKRVAVITTLSLLVAGSVGYQVYREVRNRMEARNREITSDIINGNRELEAGNLGGALPAFVDACRLEAGSDQETGDRLRLGSVRAQAPKLTHYWVLPTDLQIHDAEFSPDGTRIVVAGYQDQTRIYDLLANSLYKEPFGTNQGVFGATFSQDGQALIMVSQDSSCSTWDALNLQQRNRWRQPAALYSARFSPDRKRIVVAGDGLARVLNSDTGELELKLPVTGVVRFADFSHNGQMIVTAGENCTAQVWDANTGKPIGKPFHHLKTEAWVYHAAFSPDDKQVVTASFDRTAKVWDVGGGRVPPDMYHRNGVTWAEFSPDGRSILTASLDGTARLWNSSDHQPVVGDSLFGLGEGINVATFSRDGRQMLLAGLSYTIRVWDLAGSVLRPVPTPDIFNSQGTRSLHVADGNIEVKDAITQKLISVCTNVGPPLAKAEFSGNGGYVLGTAIVETNTLGIRAFFQIWNADIGQPIGKGLTLQLLDLKEFGATLSEDGRHVLIFHGSLAQVWDTFSGSNLTRALPQTGHVTLAKFSPDDNRLAIASGNDVTLRRVPDGQAIGETMTHPVEVSCLDFSPDGAWLATCCRDNSMTERYCQVWHTATGKTAGQRLWHGDGVLFAAFSPEGGRLVTSGEDSAAIIWDFKAGTQVGMTLNHTDQIPMATFSPDGRWVVTASEDQTARVWDAKTGYPLTPPLRHQARVKSARFLADGRRIVTVAGNGQNWIWNLPIDNLPVQDLGRVARLLSGDGVNRSKLAAQPQESVEAVWKQLQSKYPSDFATTPAEIAAWQDSQAKESEAEEDWFAAEFHLRWLVGLRPGDVEVARRLIHAQEQQLLAAQKQSDTSPDQASTKK